MTLKLGGLDVYRFLFCYIKIHHSIYVSIICILVVIKLFFKLAYCVLSCHHPFSHLPTDRTQLFILGIHISAALNGEKQRFPRLGPELPGFLAVTATLNLCFPVYARKSCIYPEGLFFFFK